MLKSISDLLLQEIKRVDLVIDNRNKNSIKLATNVGFYPNQESLAMKDEKGCCTYQKTLFK